MKVSMFNYDAIPAVRQSLDDLVKNHYSLYYKALVSGEKVDETSFDWSSFLNCGLASSANGEILFRYRCSRLMDDFLFTDRVDYVGADRVLYLSDNESLLRAQSMPQCKGASALDIGTGSGVQSIAAYRRGASQVISVDVSPRAVEVARFNLTLNGLPQKGVILADFGQFESDETFDLIVSNPPFVPVPKNTTFMTSGAGGEDGLDFVRLILHKCKTFLAPGGTLCLVSISTGGLAFSELERMLVEHFYDDSVCIDVQNIFPKSVGMDRFLEVFLGASEVSVWERTFQKRGLTHLHNLLITVSKSSRWEFHRSDLVPSLSVPVENKGSVDWPGYLDEIRLARASAGAE